MGKLGEGRRVRDDVELPLFVIADALGVHVNTVRNLLVSGRLTGLRLSDIVSYVKGRLI
jgi:hypothetical protein